MGMTTALAVLLIAASSAQTRAPVYDPHLFAWSEALKQWRHEADSAPLQLARGVLFDCAAHRQRNDILFPPASHDVAGNSACRYVLQAHCAEEAEKSFARAVRLDPTLLEARLRLAAARSERNGEGDADLQAVFDTADAPPSFRYLAGIFLGKAAYARHDAKGAAVWFAKAAGIDPQWTVAPLLRAAAGDAPPPALRTAADGSTDPWYPYRCEILTATVRGTLSGWMARVGKQ
jgi:hypothetical protein